MHPIPLRVPTSYCVPSTIPIADVNAQYVILGAGDAEKGKADEPQLLPSKMHATVFANLTIGGCCGQADASTGCVKTLYFDDELRTSIIVNCAQLKISKYARPTVEQALEFARGVGIPTRFGEHIYRELLTRLLTAIDRHVNLENLPQALVRHHDNYIYWKVHTRHWHAETCLTDIHTESSTELRGYSGPTPTHPRMGHKRIVDQAVRALAQRGTFDEVAGPTFISGPSAVKKTVPRMPIAASSTVPAPFPPTFPPPATEQPPVLIHPETRPSTPTTTYPIPKPSYRFPPRPRTITNTPILPTVKPDPSSSASQPSKDFTSDIVRLDADLAALNTHLTRLTHQVHAGADRQQGDARLTFRAIRDLVTTLNLVVSAAFDSGEEKSMASRMEDLFGIVLDVEGKVDDGVRKVEDESEG